MSATSFFNSPRVYVDFGETSLNALSGSESIRIKLERQANGRLTAAGKERAAAELRAFLKARSWRPGARGFCAIGARGVSLRRLFLPPASGENLQRMLAMQIESDFPLSPKDLAWGWRSLGESRQGGAMKLEVLVVAVRKEVVADYEELLTKAGVKPVFTLGALARSHAAPPSNSPSAQLDFAPDAIELTLASGGVPTSIRVFHRGQPPAVEGRVLDEVVRVIKGFSTGGRLFLSGDYSASTARQLEEQLGGIARCEPLKLAGAENSSAAIAALEEWVEKDRGDLIGLRTQDTTAKRFVAGPASLKLAGLALLLAVIALALPYLEAITLKPILSSRLAELKASSTNVTATIDEELAFLQYLKQNQPPYLDALYLLSKSAPNGSKIESLSMNRQCELSFRGTMRNSDQVAEFRSKLIASGFFTNVSVEEQSPAPNHQSVSIRMIAACKPYIDRQLLSVGPGKTEIEAARDRKEPAGGGMMPGMMPIGFPGGGMPMGMPPGAMPPGVRHGMPAASASRGTVVTGLPPGVTLPPGVRPPGIPIQSNH